MLELDSDRWKSLSHCYGGAGDLPDLLRRLAVDPSDEVWERLWSCLCHQGDVYPASYAAVPHIIRITEELPIPEQTAYWAFVGSIARGSLNHARRPPEDLKAEFESALVQAGHIVLRILQEKPGDETEVLTLLQALVSIRGCADLADMLEGVRDEELETACSGCEALLYVNVQDEHLYVSTQEPGGHPDPDRTWIKGNAVVDPGPEVRLEEVVPGSGSPWLARLAKQSGESALAGMLSLLYGKATCPACGQEFVVMDELCRPSVDSL